MEYLNAFLCGGVLCAVGQVLIDRTRLTPARILTGYVVAGVLLQAVGVYQPLVNWGGAGATVPLTGFGYCLAKGVRKAVAEQGLLGALPPPWCSAFWRRCCSAPGTSGETGGYGQEKAGAPERSCFLCTDTLI